MTEDRYRMPPLRASDAERDSVVAALGLHFQAGRLTAEELDDRIGQALAARTVPQLGELMADLPPVRAAMLDEGPVARRPRSTFNPLVIPALVVVALITVMLVLLGSDHEPTLWLAVPVAVLIARAIARRGMSRRP